MSNNEAINNLGEFVKETRPGNALKSLPVANQREQMGYENAVAVSRWTASKDVKPELGAPLNKAEETVQLSPDEQAANLVKSNSFYHGNSPSIDGRSPLMHSRTCISCEGNFMKALTSCPHCGQDNS